jgi:pimeloyl-ACP methyl ester carboxylesterase
LNKAAHWHAADLHGLSRLAVDGVLGTAALVEQVHHAIARVSGPTLPSRHGRTRGITGLVYRSIHGITGLVGASADLAFRQIVPRLRPAPSTPQRDRALAVLNGVLGDHLEASANPLALAMSLRHAGTALANDPVELAARFPEPPRKLAIFLHGLCMSDHHWTPTEGEDERIDLPRHLTASTGYLPLHVYYNSGRPIASNGQALAQALEALSRNWPVPIADLILIGHSMGGLVARSALHHAELLGQSWLEHTHRLIMLGSPHHGAPLERIGHKVDQALALTPFTAPFARLGRIRSAGITDLRFGHLIEPGASLLQPRHVRLYALAATLADDGGALKSRTIGDGLVPVSSALGHHRDPEMRLPTHRTALVRRTGHVGLLHHPEVARQIIDWLAEP